MNNFKKTFIENFKKLFSLNDGKEKKNIEIENESVDSSPTPQESYAKWFKEKLEYLLGLGIITVPLKVDVEEIKEYRSDKEEFKNIVNKLISDANEYNLEIFDIYDNILVLESGYYIVGDKELLDKIELKYYGSKNNS